MSTDNATRFYWAKLDKAIAIFKAGNLEEAADTCLQLCNEIRCPKSVLPFSRILHVLLKLADTDTYPAQIHPNRSLDAPRRLQPDNYWFAKSSLNRALEICTACEKTDAQSATTAGPADFAELAKVKHTVSGMLRDRLGQYTEHWKKEGRAPPPSEEEWYEIEDAREPGEGEEWSEAIVDQDGEYVGGPVTAWPFKEPTVDASMLRDKILPPMQVGPKEPTAAWPFDEPTGKQTREPLTPAGSRSCSVC
jgi:hypothetical protein